MKSSAKQTVAEHRKRLRQRGLARIEVRAPQQDAMLLRDVADALADPARAPQARMLLREHFAAHRANGFKELLASAPLEGVDLERNPDGGRAVNF